MDIIEEVFSPVYGQLCWGVKRGQGSFLTLEFGEPHLDIHEPSSPKQKGSQKVRKKQTRRIVTVRGEWHLWIYCCEWVIFQGWQAIAHWRSSTTSQIETAIAQLDGQKLLSVRVDPKSSQCFFEFDLGGVLQTRRYDDSSEQWLLYEPSGYVLIFRADGCYCHIPEIVPSKQANWQLLKSEQPIATQSNPAESDLPTQELHLEDNAPPLLSE